MTVDCKLVVSNMWRRQEAAGLCAGRLSVWRQSKRGQHSAEASVELKLDW